MKKRTGVGIGIAIVIVSVIVGIASLPDEVLIVSPSFDTSQNLLVEEKKITIPSESVPSKEQTETKEEIPVETVEQAGPEDEETQGNVIEVQVSDGIGSGDK